MIDETVEKLKQLKIKTQELEKWERVGSMTMVNRDAHYQALAHVNANVLSSVLKIVMGMKDGDLKSIDISGRTVHIRKLMQDMYSGEILFNGQIIHQFDRITIPQIAGQLQSLLEMYDPNTILVENSKIPTPVLAPAPGEEQRATLVNKLQPFADQAKDGMVSQLITLLNNEAPTPVVATPDNEINDVIREANEIAEAAKRNRGSPDPREEIEALKQRVEEMLHRVESIVAKNAPTSQGDDLLHDTIHQMQQKHDHLVDRVQQELNVLSDKITDIKEKVD